MLEAPVRMIRAAGAHLGNLRISEIEADRDTGVIAYLRDAKSKLASASIHDLDVVAGQMVDTWWSAITDRAPESLRRIDLRTSDADIAGEPDVSLIAPPDFTLIETTIVQPLYSISGAWSDNQSSIGLIHHLVTVKAGERHLSLKPQLRASPLLYGMRRCVRPEIDVILDGAERLEALWAPWFTGLSQVTLTYEILRPSAHLRVAAATALARPTKAE
jgi:hypothetical protein